MTLLAVGAGPNLQRGFSSKLSATVEENICLSVDLHVDAQTDSSSDK